MMPRYAFFAAYAAAFRRMRDGVFRSRPAVLFAICDYAQRDALFYARSDAV